MRLRLVNVAEGSNGGLSTVSCLVLHPRGVSDCERMLRVVLPNSSHSLGFCPFPDALKLPFEVWQVVANTLISKSCCFTRHVTITRQNPLPRSSGQTMHSQSRQRLCPSRKVERGARAGSTAPQCSAKSRSLFPFFPRTLPTHSHPGPSSLRPRTATA
jgi:hypothetical protein